MTEKRWDNFVFKKEDSNQNDLKDLESKIIDLLKQKGKLTFIEIANELNFKNGDRAILLNVLIKMEIQGRINKENIHVINENGINLTTRFFI